MPLVLTSSLEDHAQGPVLPKMAEIAPEAYANRIQRVGVSTPWDDPTAPGGQRYRTPEPDHRGRHDDAGTVYPTLTALEQGHRVEVVTDAAAP